LRGLLPKTGIISGISLFVYELLDLAGNCDGGFEPYSVPVYIKPV